MKKKILNICYAISLLLPILCAFFSAWTQAETGNEFNLTNSINSFLAFENKIEWLNNVIEWLKNLFPFNQVVVNYMVYILSVTILWNITYILIALFNFMFSWINYLEKGVK